MAYENLNEDISKLLDDKSAKINIIGGKWNGNIDINTKFGIFKFTETPSGCGSMIFSGYYSPILNKKFDPIKIIDIFKLMIPMLISNGIGSVITTSGDKLEIQNKILEQIGFKKLITYPNYQHGANGLYKQSLWQITL